MRYIKDFRLFEQEEINLDYYEHGKCELFAFALHKILGYGMYFFIDNEAEFEIDDDYIYGDALIHAYCKDNYGNYFDATGLTSLEEIENEHAEYVNAPEHILVSDSMFYKYIEEGFIADVDDNEIKNIEKYIMNNKSKFIINQNLRK